MSSTCQAELGLPTLGGCARHYSTQEAYDICRTSDARSPGATDESFAQCVACCEECGADCAPAGSMPLSYVCPD
jgi:hypothetical protein